MCSDRWSDDTAEPEDINRTPSGRRLLGFTTVGLQLPESRHDRQPGRPDRRQHAPHEAHEQRVGQRQTQQLRRDREREGNLAERLEVHRRGLVPVEGRPGGEAADEPADQAEQRPTPTGPRTRPGSCRTRAPAASRSRVSGSRPRCTSCSPRRRRRRCPSGPRSGNPMVRDDLVEHVGLRGEVVGLADRRHRQPRIGRQRVLERLEALGALRAARRRTGSCCRADRRAAAPWRRTRSPILPRCRRRRRCRRPSSWFCPHFVAEPTVRLANCRDAALPTTISLVPSREHPAFDDLHLGPHAQRRARHAAQRHVGVARVLLRRVRRR